MAFSSAGRSGPLADINVTPLVDVMLVLLIIFIVTAPIVARPIAVQLPQTTDRTIDRPEPPAPIELRLDAANQLSWNGQPMAIGELQARLQAQAGEHAGNLPGCASPPIRRPSTKAWRGFWPRPRRPVWSGLPSCDRALSHCRSCGDCCMSGACPADSVASRIRRKAISICAGTGVGFARHFPLSGSCSTSKAVNSALSKSTTTVSPSPEARAASLGEGSRCTRSRRPLSIRLPGKEAASSPS